MFSRDLLKQQSFFVFPQALMSWYCYEKFFNHAVTAAVAAQRTFGNVPIYSFFHAFGTLMQGKLGEKLKQNQHDKIHQSRD